MKFLKNIIRSRFVGAILAVAPAIAGLSSCDAFNETLEPCPSGVVLRFIYDYNLEFANAFPSQVDCLTLFVYDAEGNYVETRTETSDKLADENYRMILDLPEGEYQFVAYGGMECDESSFHFISVPAPGSKIEDLSVELNSGIANEAEGKNLHPLFYGRISAEVPSGATDYTYATLPMMKDTNNLRILLQELSGAPVDDKDFEFTIIDDNTLMAWNNDVVPQANVEYHPWTTGQVSTGELPDGGEVVMAYAELSFPRLVLTNSPTLLITRRSDGSEVVRLPLNNYLLALKSDVFKDMPQQEFLDRESMWSMIFFLDHRNKWVTVQIIVKNWVVRINNTSL